MLTAFLDLLFGFDARRMLVVAPLRVARKVWRDEINNWAHLKGLSIANITGTPAQRMKALRTAADIHTINFENLDWLYSQFVQDGKQVRRWPWDIVVPDEGQKLKNRSSIRWKRMNALRKLFPRMVILTGSPVPNGYQDLWALYYLLDRGERLGHTEEAFLERWFDMPQRDGEHSRPVLKPGAKEQIEAAIADITIAMRAEDYLDLPPVLINPIRVDLPEATFKLYKQFARKFIGEFGGNKVTAVNAGALNNKLLQLANGAVYYDKTGQWADIHEAKLHALAELLEELDGKKVMIAYYFKHDFERISKVLNSLGQRWRVCRTEQDEEDWEKGLIDHLLVHPDSIGEGANLHKNECEDIIWFGLTANLLSWQQLNGRLFGGGRRLGKNGRIHVILADGTIDERYSALLAEKAEDQDSFNKALSDYVIDIKRS